MRLPMLLGIFNPLFENILRLLDELTVEIYRVRSNPSVRIVLPEYKFRRLLVVLVHFPAVGFAFFGEFFGQSAVSAFVGMAGLFFC